MFSVLTFATNKIKYWNFAINCAQSIAKHNPNLPVYIVTNLKVKVPKKFKNVFLIKINDHLAKKGLGLKLEIDKFMPTDTTLFIDSDCLCFSNLDRLMKSFRGNNLSVVGNIVKSEDWCGADQAKSIKERFGLSNLVRFNAGIIYLNEREKVSKLFDMARNIALEYDLLGFERNHGYINEEGLLSIAMMLNCQTPVPDDGTYMTDLYTDYYPSQLNVLTGDRIIKNPGIGEPRHRSWYPQSYSPMILHFGGRSVLTFPYLKQHLLLRLNRLGASDKTATTIASLVVAVLLKPVICLIGLLKKF